MDPVWGQLRKKINVRLTQMAFVSRYGFFYSLVKSKNTLPKDNKSKDVNYVFKKIEASINT